ncbi:MAG: phosphoribosylanthranilate isomerase [Roseiflexaceae bacterium]|nr:phosphoribosylanthranilate isomerase [Roseiflexaceae bacterium]
MTRTKICGIQTIEHARVAAEAGADMIGLVFAPSKRRVDVDQAAEIVAALRELSVVPLIVGLFVNELPERIAATVERCDLDAIQLSGDEPTEIMRDLPSCMLIKALRLAGDPGEQGWLALPATQVTLHVDAHVAGSYGGTGITADWERAAALARQRRVILAGGLGPHNVAAAISQVQPWVVDVSSGVESDGQKDSAKIRAFITAARGQGHA